MQRTIHKRSMYFDQGSAGVSQTKDSVVLPKEKPKNEVSNFCSYSNQVQTAERDLLLKEYFSLKEMLKEVSSKLYELGIDPERPLY